MVVRYRLAEAALLTPRTLEVRSVDRGQDIEFQNTEYICDKVGYNGIIEQVHYYWRCDMVFEWTHSGRHCRWDAATMDIFIDGDCIGMASSLFIARNIVCQYLD